MATLVPEFISVLRDIRDIKYPDIVTKHGEVAVNAGLTSGYKDTALTYKDAASASASSALANKNATDANVITTNNNVATTNADASTCTAKALIASQVLAMTASASTLVAGSLASASFNPTTGIMSFGIPAGPKGDRGDAFVVNAFGLLANRTTYDGQPVNFSFYATDAGLIYFKLSNTSGDWSTGVPFGKGDTGDTGNGITSITLTGTVGSVDTYRILFTDATFFDFNVTNGSVTSVAGRTGAITLVKEDVGLSNVDNTSDLLKPLSTAEIDALASKAPIASPEFTGTPTAPTATAGTKTTQLATTAFANSLLAEYTVTGAVATSINFTGLDIATHKSYRVEIENVNNVAGSYLSLFANGDTTASNYTEQQIGGVNTTSVIQSIPAPRLGYCKTISTISTMDVTVKQVNGYVVFQSYNFAETNDLNLYAGRTNATKTNLIQLTFTHGVANGFGIGSKIRIYRGDV